MNSWHRLTRGLTIPSSGPAFGSPLKSNVRRRRIPLMSTSFPIDREEFLRALATQLPEIAAKITDIESGLLHPEIAVVSQATHEAIEAQDWQAVATHFSFITEVFAEGTEAVKNAVCVSYLENVFLGETSVNHESARSMLPPILATALAELENHFEKLSRAQPDA